jgi:hypothetical protein
MPAQTKREFRVYWRREGLHRATAIYQTEAAARRKADGILALDALKEGSRLAVVPDVVDGPVIEVRDVSNWREHERVTELDDEACAGMQEWLFPGGLSGGIATGGVDW